MSETEILRALADPTRRAVFEKLAEREMNVTELRAGLLVSQPAVSQHLAVLKGAGLIAERREGRHVQYRVDPGGLEPLHAWLGRYRAFWPARIEKLKDLLREMDQ